MEERKAENDKTSPVQEDQNQPDSKTVEISYDADLETKEGSLEEHLEVSYTETNSNSDNDGNVKEEQLENSEQGQAPQLTLEQAQELCCISFNNALYLSQFPEIASYFNERVAENVKQNPQYAIALENALNSLAAHVDKQVVGIEAGEPLTTQYKCGLTSCDKEQCTVQENADVNCETTDAVPSLTP